MSFNVTAIHQNIVDPRTSHNQLGRQGPWQRLCRCTEKVQAETNLENKYWWILVLSDTFLGLNQVRARAV